MCYRQQGQDPVNAAPNQAFSHHSGKDRGPLGDSTVGRSAFRIHPDTPMENGVEPGLKEADLAQDLRQVLEVYVMADVADTLD